MEYTGKLTAMLPLAIVAATLAADPSPTAKEWVEGYAKLGGKAFLSPPEESAIGIQKREGQKPLVSLRGLPPVNGIRRVRLQGFEIADEDVEALAGWKELQHIDLIDAKKVTDKGVKALASLPELRELVLADTAVTSAGVNAFSGHQKLASLTVSNTVVENQVKSIDLAGMPELQSLTLVCVGMTAVRLSKLPKLESVANFPRELEKAEVSGAGVLTELEFGGTKVNTLTLSDLPRLKLLDLRRTPLRDDDVAGIQKAFPNIKVQR